MPGPFDFKGQKIQDTYVRVVQIATGSFYDGKGTLINADIQAIADTSNQRQSESIELSAISSSVFELQQFSSSLDADFATDDELSALSSSILVTTNDLSSSIQDNENELSNQDGRITSLTAATSSYVVFPYTGSAIITGSLEVIGDITGSGKLELNTPNNNVIVGYQAGQNDPSNQNVFVGYQAGKNVTTGKHVAIGYQAGASMSSIQNIAIGHLAGGSGGAYNITLGADARRNSAGQANISIGHAAFRSHGSNNNAVGIGYAVGRFGGGTGAVLLGHQAGYSLSGDYNIGLGYDVGYDLTGEYNTVLGYQAGYNLTGSKNVVLGHQAGYNLTGSNQLIIANNSSSALITGDFANNTLDISGSVSASTYYGDGSNLTGIETDPFPYTGSAIISGSLEVDGNIELTKKINGVGITTNNSNNSIYLATADSDTLSVGNYQTIIHGGIGGNYAVHIGRSAGNGRTSTQNVVIGTNAGSYGRSGDAGSTLVGHSAGIGSNSYSTIIGNSAGTGVKGVYTSVQENVIIGRNAGGNVINYSTTIGSFSGRALLGDYNITVGHHTGYNGIGDNLIFLGKEAGYNASGSNNILIGYQAGYNLTGSNQLIIANNSSSALITGDFANNTLGISGSVSASTYYGDGSNLTGISTTPFPYIGSAIITGSLTVSGSVVDFTSASAVNLNIDSLPLINPIVEYLDVTSSIASGTTLTLPNNLSYISSSTYEYLEIFMNGLRTRYNIDFVPMSNTTIQTQIAFPSGSELTFKSLKR